MDRGLPSPEFKLRPHHALFLVDLVIAVGIFYGVGKLYMDKKGTALLAEKEKTRVEAQVEGARLIAEADSVMQAGALRLEQMRADSVANLLELNRKRTVLQVEYAQRDSLAQNVFRISDVVQGLQGETQKSAAKVEEYESNVQQWSKEAEVKAAELEAKEKLLQETLARREEADQKLREAISMRTYEPASVLPERSGVVVQQEVAEGDRMTGVQFQHVVHGASTTDLGLAVGIGLGSGERASNKQVGLLLSRSLIHRRLGLDLSAGFSHMTDDAGNGDAGAYAGAALRYSPFYKERFHLSLGAEADHGEVLPFIGIGLGRR